jgi:4-amino-4-deoxy-L-arabinose transferase-like glycosyltransferase
MRQGEDLGDRVLAFGTGVLVVVVLYVTAPRIGYARDEGWYFEAAAEYGRWLAMLVDHPDQALTRAAVDAHFRVNIEHPSLMKFLFAVSHRLLFERFHLIPTPGLAYRLPGMLMSGLATSLIVLWASRSVSRWAGFVAGALFITMPRVFHHAHLACFDMPVVATTLLTVYAYSMAITTRRLAWVVAVGVFYGLALDTKHNAWTLPAVLLCHLLLTEGRSLWICPPNERWLRLLPVISMLTVGPVVLFVLWPWLWFDTLGRLRFWVEFHLQHDYYNMEFLGRTYHRPPMPRAYAWVMTVATVPLTTLLLAAVGLFVSLRHALRSGQAWKRVGPVEVWQQRDQGDGTDPHDTVRREPPRSTLAPAPWDARRTTDLLWLLCLLSAYAPWWFTSTPIFGGTKHWLPAYPYLCLFAARGFGWFAATLRDRFGRVRGRRWRWRAISSIATLVWLSAPAVITIDSVPFGLSAYTPLVRGAPGAASLGLNRTFWGYTSIEMAEPMSQLLPDGGSVFIHDSALPSWEMHQRDGTIARNLYPTLDPARSSVALYHYEPHMSRVEYQIWEAYHTTSPEVVTTFDGVPVLWLYARPEITGNHSPRGVE